MNIVIVTNGELLIPL